MLCGLYLDRPPKHGITCCITLPLLPVTPYLIPSLFRHDIFYEQPKMYMRRNPIWLLLVHFNHNLTKLHCSYLLQIITKYTLPTLICECSAVTVKRRGLSFNHSDPSTFPPKYRTFCRTSGQKNTGHFTGLQKPISLHLLGIIVSQQYSISSDVGGQ